MKQSRRSFLVSCAAAGAAIATGAAAEEKTVDGGYAAVSEPGRKPCGSWVMLFWYLWTR